MTLRPFRRLRVLLWPTLLCLPLSCGSAPSEEPPPAKRQVPDRFQDLVQQPLGEGPLRLGGTLEGDSAANDATPADPSGGEALASAPEAAPESGEPAPQDPVDSDSGEPLAGAAGQPQPAAGETVGDGEAPSEGGDPAGSGPAQGPRYTDETVVATFEVTVPGRRGFVMHGTVPVPSGYELPEAGRTNLAIVDRSNGSRLVPAQLEVVSRGPDGAVEVLEVLARVGLHPDDLPGKRVRYDLVQTDLPLLDAPQLPAPVRELLDPEGPGLTLSTRDVYGNRYEVDLLGRPESPGHGSNRTLREGASATTRRTHSVLVPKGRSNAGPPLPHLMGVHAYITTWDRDERVTLDLRVHNGLTSGATRPGPLDRPAGIVYWDSLELELPAEWDVEPLVSDPFFGPSRLTGEQTLVPIVASYENDVLHMMGPQAQLHRRLTLVPRRLSGGRRDSPVLEGLAFCVPGLDRWSWSNPETARYLPQRGILPTWEGDGFQVNRGHFRIRQRLNRERDQYASMLTRGEGDGAEVASGVIGWAHPWLYSIEGATGGSGIAPYEGHLVAGAASVAGYEQLLLRHQMNASRQPDTQYDSRGDPIGFHGWLDAQGRVPFDFRTHNRVLPISMRLPCHGGPAASPQVAAVHERELRPPYDLGTPHLRSGRVPGNPAALLAWMPHDGQHMARYTKPTQALVWLGNDMLAKDDLLHAAALFRLMFHEADHVRASWSPGITLAVYRELAEGYPNQGLPIDRDHAWGIDAMCAAYSVASDEWRARERPWFDEVADLLLLGVMPNGLLARREHPKLCSDRFAGTQSFEEFFLIHARRVLVNSVLLDDPEDERVRGLEESVLRALEYLLWGPPWGRNDRGGGGQAGAVEFGPRFYFPVAPKGGYERLPFNARQSGVNTPLPAEGMSPVIESWNIWSGVEYGLLLHQSRGDDQAIQRLLDRSAEAWIAPGNIPRLVESLLRSANQLSGDNSGTWAGLIGLLERRDAF